MGSRISTSYTGLGGNAESTSSATFTATQPATDVTSADTSTSTDTTGSLTGQEGSSGTQASACGASGCCSIFGGECSPNERDCTTAITNEACSVPSSRLRRTRYRHRRQTEEADDEDFVSTFIGFRDRYGTEAFQCLVNKAAVAIGAHIQGGRETIDDVGFNQTYPERVKLAQDGVTELPGQFCTPRDPAARCKSTGNLIRAPGDIGARIDRSLTFPLFCGDKQWTGPAVSLIEDYVVLEDTKRGKKKGKKKKVTYTRPIPYFVELLENTTALSSREPGAQLLRHCPNITQYFVRGEGKVDYDEGCGLRERKSRKKGKKNTKKGKKAYEVEYEYACDHFDLTSACTGPYGNPRNEQIQVSCFEVCAALGESVCTGYVIDLNPVNASDPDIDNRELFGNCFIYDTPQLIRPHFSASPTAMPTIAPTLAASSKKKGRSREGKTRKSPKTPAPTAAPYLQMFKQCGYTASVLNETKLAKYEKASDLCTDPDIVWEPRIVRKPKGKKGELIVLYNDTCEFPLDDSEGSSVPNAPPPSPPSPPESQNRQLQVPGLNADCTVSIASGFTCGARINWLIDHHSMPMFEAVSAVVHEYPIDCAVCSDPESSINALPCSSAQAQGKSCGDRIRHVMSAKNISVHDAIHRIIRDFPNECGHCQPVKPHLPKKRILVKSNEPKKDESVKVLQDATTSSRSTRQAITIFAVATVVVGSLIAVTTIILHMQQTHSLKSQYAESSFDSSTLPIDSGNVLEWDTGTTKSAAV